MRLLAALLRRAANHLDPPYRHDVTYAIGGDMFTMTDPPRPSPEFRAAIERARQRQQHCDNGHGTYTTPRGWT